MTQTCQLLQNRIAPPKRCMVAEDLPYGGLPLGMEKPPTQQKKTAFHLISFQDTIPGDQSPHPAKTGRLNPIPTEIFAKPPGLSS